MDRRSGEIQDDLDILQTITVGQIRLQHRETMLHTVWVFLHRIRAAQTLAKTEGKSSAESALP